MKQLKPQNAVPDEEVRKELQRILQSRLLNSSRRLCRFIRFVVDSALNGSADKLKESLIGTEVYDRKPDYDPSQDSIVRTESHRLRGKLEAYYESEGKDDPVVIYFRPGSYTPLFRFRHSSSSEITAASNRDSSQDSLAHGSGICVAVIPFVDLSGNPVAATFARDLSDELIHELAHTPGVRVTAASAITSSSSQTEIIPELAKKLGVQLIFEGTVREEAGRLRVISRIVNFDGFQVCSQRFEAHADSQGLFALTERVASALVYRIRPEQSIVRKLNATVSESLLSLLPRLLAAELLVDEGTVGDIQRALGTFKEVHQALPNFARPLCGTAQAQCEIALRGLHNGSNLVASANDAANRAVALDPEMISARVATAFVRMLEWNWSEAESNFRHALEGSDHACGYRQYGLFLTALGRFDDAFYYLQKAQQIDPFSGRQKAAFAKFFYLSSREEEAAGHFSNHSVFGPPGTEAEITLAFIQIKLGNTNEAIRTAQEIKRNAGAQPGLMASVAEIMAHCGDAASATHLLRESKGSRPVISEYRQALLLLSMKDATGALSHLTRACEEREPEMIWLKVDPRFRLVRELPEFAALLEKVMPASES